jgi:KRAB domain-containing zinc finger protein
LFLVPEHEPKIFDQFFVCRRCKIFFKGRKFRKLHNLMKHRRKKLDASIPKVRKIRTAKKEPLICDLCSRSFKIKALIRSHMNSHLSEKVHQCNLCDYASKRYNDLRKHHQTHHDPTQITQKRSRRKKCDKCDEILANKKALRVHIRLKHQEKKKKKRRVFKTCEKCNEVLYNKRTYKMHMKEKHGESTFIKCETCNRKFKTNFRLRKHEHRYGKKFVKNICIIC